jgi:hypothetical protein
MIGQDVFPNLAGLTRLCCRIARPEPTRARHKLSMMTLLTSGEEREKEKNPAVTQLLFLLCSFHTNSFNPEELLQHRTEVLHLQRRMYRKHGQFHPHIYPLQSPFAACHMQACHMQAALTHVSIPLVKAQCLLTSWGSVSGHASTGLFELSCMYTCRSCFAFPRVCCSVPHSGLLAGPLLSCVYTGSA